jgi:hypothetical protein
VRKKGRGSSSKMLSGASERQMQATGLDRANAECSRGPACASPPWLLWAGPSKYHIPSVISIFIFTFTFIFGRRFIYIHIYACAHSHTHTVPIPTTTRYSAPHHTLPKQPPSRRTHAQHAHPSLSLAVSQPTTCSPSPSRAGCQCL